MALTKLKIEESMDRIAEAITNDQLTQDHVAEINSAATTAKASITAKTNEQLARIPEVTTLQTEVTAVKQYLSTQLKLDEDGTFYVEMEE